MYTAVPIPCSMAGTSKTSLFSAANSSSAKGQYCCLSSCRLMNLANTGGKRPNSPHRGQGSKAAVPPRRVTPSAAAEGHRGDVSVQERAATTRAMSLFFSPENKESMVSSPESTPTPPCPYSPTGSPPTGVTGAERRGEAGPGPPDGRPGHPVPPVKLPGARGTPHGRHFANYCRAERARRELWHKPPTQSEK